MTTNESKPAESLESICAQRSRNQVVVQSCYVSVPHCLTSRNTRSAVVVCKYTEMHRNKSYKSTWEAQTRAGPNPIRTTDWEDFQMFRGKIFMKIRSVFAEIGAKLRENALPRNVEES